LLSVATTHAATGRFVSGKDVTALQPERRDFVGKRPGILRRNGARLRLGGVAVLLLAGNPVGSRRPVGGMPHMVVLECAP
jgi:hypothetical protein